MRVHLRLLNTLFAKWTLCFFCNTHLQKDCKINIWKPFFSNSNKLGGPFAKSWPYTLEYRHVVKVELCPIRGMSFSSSAVILLLFSWIYFINNNGLHKSSCAGIWLSWKKDNPGSTGRPPRDLTDASSQSVLLFMWTRPGLLYSQHYDSLCVYITLTPTIISFYSALIGFATSQIITVIHQTV